MRRIATVLVVASGCGHPVPRPSPVAELAVRDVRVFDGERVLEHQTVLVGGGRIVAVGPVGAITVPPNAKVVTAANATLLPGLIDAHAHVNDDADPVDALAFGVTTEIDMMSSPDVSVRLARDPSPEHARVVPAGSAATVPGGHGTEYGFPVPTLTKPEEAEAFVAARATEGSHHLKIVIENGAALGRVTPTLDVATVRALVVAAHAHHLLAVAHVGSTADVAVALAGGVDGLVHVPVQALSQLTIDTIAKRKLFVAPTLSVIASICGDHGGATLAGEARIASLLTPEAAKNLASTFPSFTSPQLDCAAPAAIVAALRRGGVSLLAGTDAPNPGTAHGASLHDELARLVAAGLDPREALVAATSAAARAFGLADLGAIRVGARADLVLVDGDPTRDITATRAIRAIWRDGHPFDLEARRTTIAAAVKADAEALARGAKDLLGPLADFETSDQPRIGQLRAASDQLMGGTSTSAIAVATGGAAGTKRALAVSGTVVLGPRGGFAGVAVLPAATGFSPVDLTAVHRVRFWVRGDGKSYALFVSTAQALASQPFVAPKDWTQVTLEMSAFATPLDGVVALTWAHAEAGAFAFQIDQLAFE